MSISHVYIVEYDGGPHHGEWAFCIRPYHRLELDDGCIYEADPDDPDFMTWESDDTRRIILKFKEMKNGTEVA